MPIVGSDIPPRPSTLGVERSILMPFRFVRAMPTNTDPTHSRSRRSNKRRWLLGTLLIIMFALVTLGATSEGRVAMGASASGARLERMKASPHFRDGKFIDVLPRREPEFVPTLKAWFFDASEYSIPQQPLPLMRRTRADFDELPTSGLRVTWLGHSTLIVEIDGVRVLVDPVWGKNPSPFEWMTADRFFEPPLPFSELPPIDAVVISHDHYDHLDYPTIRQLATSQVPFFVPLGIGAHLEHWGIDSSRIVELDWWDRRQVGGVTLVATPARHFSGRSLVDRDHTLWAGWAMLGPKHRAFYSGDTAMFPGFKEIGERLGPFDVTMIESGAYDPLWADVHLGPEQAVLAHTMVRGELMIPVHWGLFNLSLHGWTEPVERVLAAAEQAGIQVTTPRPGQSIEPGMHPIAERWWPDLPWRRARDLRVVSSGLPPELLHQLVSP